MQPSVFLVMHDFENYLKHRHRMSWADEFSKPLEPDPDLC